MEYQYFFEYFVLGASGAAAAELLKLYELRSKWDEPKYSAAIRSPIFWLIVLGMLAASGFIAWAMNATTDLAPWQVVLSGIGARTLIRSPVQASVSRQKMKLGAPREVLAFAARDLFA